MQWWGYSKEHGWVVLDRRVPCNTHGIKADLLFLRCRDTTTFSVKRETWNEPLYTYAPNYIRGRGPAGSVEAAAEFEDVKARWPEFEREIQRVQREAEERAEAIRVEEENDRKRAASEKRKLAAAAKA